MPHSLSGLRRFVSLNLWAMLPEYLDAMLDVLQLRADGVRFTEAEIAARLVAANHGALGTGAKPVAPSSGAIAVLPLYGLLSPKGDFTPKRERRAVN